MSVTSKRNRHKTSTNILNLLSSTHQYLTSNASYSYRYSDHSELSSHTLVALVSCQSQILNQWAMTPSGAKQVNIRVAKYLATEKVSEHTQGTKNPRKVKNMNFSKEFLAMANLCCSKHASHCTQHMPYPLHLLSPSSPPWYAQPRLVCTARTDRPVAVVEM